MNKRFSASDLDAILVERPSLLRPLLSGLLAVLAVLAVALFVERDQRRHADQLHHEEMVLLLDDLRADLKRALGERLDILRGIASVVEADPQFAQTNFVSLVAALQGQIPGVLSVQLAPGGVIRHATGGEAIRSVIGTDLFSHPATAQGAKASRELAKTLIEGPLDLVQGGRALIARRPVYRASRSGGAPEFWGFVTILFGLQDVFPSLKTRGRDGMTLSVRSETQVGDRPALMFGDGRIFDGPAPRTTLAMPSGMWTLALGGTDRLPDRLLSWRETLWGIAAGAALVLGLGAFAFARRRQTLSQTFARYRLLGESTVSFMTLFEPSGRAVFDSPSLVRRLGKDYSPGRAVGAMLLPPDDARARELFARALSTGEEQHAEMQAINPEDGEIGELSWHLAPIMADDGRVAAVLMSAHDISELASAQAQLEESEERYRLLAENASDFISLYDAQGRVLYDSPSMQRLLNLKDGEARMQGNCVHPADREAVHRFFNRIVDQGGASRLEFRLVKPDGEVIWVEGRGTAIPGPDGKTEKVLGVQRDITERRRAEVQLRQAQTMETVGLLTAGLAHDFRNLLGVAVGNLDLIQEMSEGNARLTGRAVAARDALERGLAITNSLMRMSRRQEGDAAEFDLNNLVDELMPLVRTSVGSGVLVEPRLHGEPLPVLVERDGFGNMLLNLAVNARDATRRNAGERSLWVSTRKVVQIPPEAGLAADGEYAALEVRDNGCGMSQEVLRRAFEPLFTTKPEGEGTGLGLSMVYGYARQHNGGAAIESTPGEGTTVSLYFPLA